MAPSINLCRRGASAKNTLRPYLWHLNLTLDGMCSYLSFKLKQHSGSWKLWHTNKKTQVTLKKSFAILLWGKCTDFSARSKSRDKRKECMPTLHRPQNSHSTALCQSETNKSSNQWSRLWTTAEAKEQMTVSHLLWQQITLRGWAGEYLASKILKRNHLIDSGSKGFFQKELPQCNSTLYSLFSHLHSSGLEHPKNSERFFVFRHYVLWCNTHLKAATANLSLFVPIHQVVCF